MKKNLIKTFEIISLFGGLILNGCEKKDITKQNQSDICPKLIHEYIDLNTDNKYEIHRLVFEKNGYRWFDNDYKLDYFNPGIIKKSIEISPLVGNERRFLK